ncbi:LysR family transcriptional regulator, partial [Acinetobacter baumannii]
LDGYCGERHLIVGQSGERRGIADQALAKLGRERRVVAALPYFLAALATVSRTDLVATLPRALVEAFATHFSLAVVEPP